MGRFCFSRYILILLATVFSVGCGSVKKAVINRDSPALDMSEVVEMWFAFGKDTVVYGDEMGVGIEWRNISERVVTLSPLARIMFTAGHDTTLNDGADVADIYVENLRIAASYVEIKPGESYRRTVRIKIIPGAFAEKPVEYGMLLRTGINEGEDKLVFKSMNTRSLTVVRSRR